jgi:hypothetical protein
MPLCKYNKAKVVIPYKITTSNIKYTPLTKAFIRSVSTNYPAVREFPKQIPYILPKTSASD